MSTDSKFAPRALTASEYVRELFGPEVPRKKPENGLKIDVDAKMSGTTSVGNRGFDASLLRASSRTPEKI